MNKQTGRVYKPSSVWKAPVVTSNMPVNKPVLTSDKVKLLTRQNVQFPGTNQTSTKTDTNRTKDRKNILPTQNIKHTELYERCCNEMCM